MAYNTIEISEYSGEPVELYTFTRNTTEWRYTSYSENVTFEGKEYLTGQLERSSYSSTSDLKKSYLKVVMSRKLDFLNQFIATSPTDVITLEIKETHIGDVDEEVITTWKGNVINVKFFEDFAEVRIEPLFNSLKRAGLRRVYQINCPHVLYGNECKIAKNSFAITAALDSVSGNLITSSAFIQSGDAVNDPTWYVGGFVEYTHDGVTDRRFITNHDNGAGTLTLNLSFVGLNTGDTVTVYAGCNHTPATCNSKFNNILNYGGFPHIPNKNPMDGTPVF